MSTQSLNMAITGAATTNGTLDMDKFEALVSQLDPVALSIGSGVSGQVVTGFNSMALGRARATTAGNNVGAGTFRGQLACDPCAPIACGILGGFRSTSRELWFQGQGGLIDQKDADGILGYYTNTYGYTLGMDRRIARRTVVGLGFSNNFYDTRMNHGLGTANTKTYLFSAYGGHREGNWLLSGSTGYVRSNLKSTRVVESVGYAQGKRNADSFFSAFELARQFGSDWSYLTPFLGYDFVRYREGAFTETGQVIDMNVDKRRVNAYVQTLGARMGMRYVNRNGWIVNPVVTMGWIHDYGKGQTVTTAAFNEGGGRMVLDGTSRNKDRALIGFSLNTEVNRGLSIFGRYDGELASKYNSQNFQAGAVFQF